MSKDLIEEEMTSHYLFSLRIDEEVKSCVIAEEMRIESLPS